MAAREKVADKNVATTELAAVLGISARRVQQLAQDGILDTVERGKFELSAAVQAYIRFLGRDAMTEEDKKLESAKRKAEATLKLSKAKIAKAQADELSGQMHRSEDVAAMTADLIYTIRGALMAFPGRVAIDAAAITDAAEEAEYLRKEVNILCAQLAQYRYDPKAYESLQHQCGAVGRSLQGMRRNCEIHGLLCGGNHRGAGYDGERRCQGRRGRYGSERHYDPPCHQHQGLRR